MPTFVEFLEGCKSNHEEQVKNDYPFNERELAKAEVVDRMLQLAESGYLT